MLEPQALCLNTRAGRSPQAMVLRAFTLIDLLVSIAVVAVLIAIMVPSLSTVRESARRVVCASNVRQIGLGLGIYTDDYRDKLPPSKFADPAGGSGGANSTSTLHQRLMIVRTTDAVDAWDGLGVLFAAGYLDAPGVFYCPSHHGDHPYSAYAPYWAGDPGQIVANYHFRGAYPSSLDAAHDNVAMVADGMASRSDYNHRIGANVLRADLTVSWFADVGGQIANSLPQNGNDPAADQKIGDAWDAMDQSGRLR